MSFHRIGLAALAFGAVFSVSLAQDGPPPGGQGGPPPPGQQGGPPPQGMRGQRTMMQANWPDLAAKLHLTDDQVTKLKAVVQDHVQKIQSLISDSSKPIQERQASVKATQDAYKSAVKGILTDQQYTDLEDIGGPRRFLGGPPTPFEVLSTLDITDEQKAKAKVIFSDERKSFEALQQDKTGGPEMFNKMRSIHKEAMDKLKAILSDEQFTKFQSLMQRGPGMRRPGGPPPGGGAPGGPPPGGAPGGPPPGGGGF